MFSNSLPLMGFCAAILGAVWLLQLRNEHRIRRLRRQLYLTSRELHRIRQTNLGSREIGQNLSCLIIQLQSARRMSQVKPNQLDDALDRCTRLARLCLDDIRGQVSILEKTKELLASSDRRSR